MKVSAIQSTYRPNYMNGTRNISRKNGTKIYAESNSSNTLSFKRSPVGAPIGGLCFGTLSVLAGSIAAAYNGIVSVSSGGILLGMVAGGLAGAYLFDKLDKKLFEDKTQKQK